MSVNAVLQVISYYRDPHGERVLKSVTGTHHVQMDSSGALTLRKPNQERINTLERKVTELEEQLNTYKVCKCIHNSLCMLCCSLVPTRWCQRLGTRLVLFV